MLIRCISNIFTSFKLKQNIHILQFLDVFEGLNLRRLLSVLAFSLFVVNELLRAFQQYANYPQRSIFRSGDMPFY